MVTDNERTRNISLILIMGLITVVALAFGVVPLTVAALVVFLILFCTFLFQLGRPVPLCHFCWQEIRHLEKCGICDSEFCSDHLMLGIDLMPSTVEILKRQKPTLSLYERICYHDISKAEQTYVEEQRRERRASQPVRKPKSKGAFQQWLEKTEGRIPVTIYGTPAWGPYERELFQKPWTSTVRVLFQTGLEVFHGDLFAASSGIQSGFVEPLSQHDRRKLGDGYFIWPTKLHMIHRVINRETGEELPLELIKQDLGPGL